MWRPGPGGFSLIEDYHSTDEKGEHIGLAIMWWDENMQRYQVTWCDDGSPACIVYTKGGKWEGNDLVLRHTWEQGGKKCESRQITSDITPASFRQISYEGETGRELKTVFTILGTKLTKPN